MRPLLQRRDKLGYIAARDTRIINDTLAEYFSFKNSLIRKYGEEDKDADGKSRGTISLRPDSPGFQSFAEEFEDIRTVEQDVELLTMKYEDVIGVLSGEEMLILDPILED